MYSRTKELLVRYHSNNWKYRRSKTGGLEEFFLYLGLQVSRMVDVNLALAVIGGTAVLGYVTQVIFEKTRIPDAILLIIFGMLVSFVGAIPTTGLLTLAPVLANIAIVVMSFEFAVRMDFEAFLKGLPRASLLSVISVVLTTLGIGLMGVMFLGLDAVRSLLLGVIIAGVSSAPIERQLEKIRLRDDFKGFAKAESVLSDVITFVIAILLINLYTMGNIGNPVQIVSVGVLVAIVIGVIIGILRLAVEDEVKGKPYNYILTLGMAFIAYVGIEWFNGIGALATLAYGLVLGNAKRLPRFMGKMCEYVPSSFLKKFYSEISLFLRAFFFVLLGTLAVGVLNGSWWWGLAILAVIILVRMPVVEIAMLKKSMSRYESSMLKCMLPRDLQSIVLVLFAASQGVMGTDSWLGIVFVVIVGSVIYTTAATLLIKDGSAPQRKFKPVDYEKLPKRKLWKKYGER